MDAGGAEEGAGFGDVAVGKFFAFHLAFDGFEVFGRGNPVRIGLGAIATGEEAIHGEIHVPAMAALDGHCTFTSLHFIRGVCSPLAEDYLDVHASKGILGGLRQEEIHAL